MRNTLHGVGRTHSALAVGLRGVERERRGTGERGVSRRRFCLATEAKKLRNATWNADKNDNWWAYVGALGRVGVGNCWVMFMTNASERTRARFEAVGRMMHARHAPSSMCHQPRIRIRLPPFPFRGVVPYFVFLLRSTLAAWWGMTSLHTYARGRELVYMHIYICIGALYANVMVLGIKYI